MTALIGLVLCGGRSSRMGSDKSQLVYHKKPQYQHAHDLIAPFCEKTFISCHVDQVSLYPTGTNILTDASTYNDIGPMAALLTAFDQYPQHSFLLVGCDYPNIGEEALAILVNARQEGVEAVCFVNEEGIDEPLIAVYENGILARLKKSFGESRFSMRFLLKESSVKRIRGDRERLRNMNSGSGK